MLQCTSPFPLAPPGPPQPYNCSSPPSRAWLTRIPLSCAVFGTIRRPDCACEVNTTSLVSYAVLKFLLISIPNP